MLNTGATTRHRPRPKTITGTVGSVDATGRTVTLSPASAGWSANTGNYLLGPDLVLQ